MNMDKAIVKWYLENIESSEAEIRKFERRANTYSLMRLFALLFGGLMIWQSLKFEQIWLTELAM